MGKNNQAKRKAKKAERDQAARRSLKVISDLRPCAGCTACCSVFGVEEIDKPAWQPCPNLSDSGCAIYATRPRYCHSFYCMYQHGLGSASDRPDKLGVIFAPTNGKTDFTGEVEIQAYEIEPLAFNRPEVIKLAKTFGDKGKLVIGHVFGGQDFRFVGPSAKISKALHWVEKNKQS